MGTEPTTMTPDLALRFMGILGLALHCQQWHSLDCKPRDGEWLISLCADNCPIHFETVSREMPKQCTAADLVVNLCTMLWDNASKMVFFNNGMELRCAQGTIRVMDIEP